MQARLATKAKHDATSMELCTHTMGQLKALCAQHGLRKSGVKAELVARLCDTLCADEPAAKRPRTKVRVPVGASALVVHFDGGGRD